MPLIAFIHWKLQNKQRPAEEPCMCLNLYFAFQCLFVRRPIYLSEHILEEMSEWYWQRRGESGGESTYCSVCTHPAHSIPGNCSASKKSCHYFVTQPPRWHLQQITWLAEKKKRQKTGSHIFCLRKGVRGSIIRWRMYNWNNKMEIEKKASLLDSSS